MEDKAKILVDELIGKCIEIGLDEKMSVNCATLHINQMLLQSNTTQEIMLYKNMLNIITNLKK